MYDMKRKLAIIDCGWWTRSMTWLCDRWFGGHHWRSEQWISTSHTRTNRSTSKSFTGPTNEMASVTRSCFNKAGFVLPKDRVHSGNFNLFNMVHGTFEIQA